MRNRFFATLFVVVALIFGVTNSASADQWDYIYGEDPTNANNVSVFLEVKPDPLGGMFLIGYFYGSYEGLSSSGNYSFFVQHRRSDGLTDWTVPFESLATSEVPFKSFSTFVDGQGGIFVQSYERSIHPGASRIDGLQRTSSNWYSISQNGVLTTETDTEFAGDSQLCTQGIGAADGGLVQLCGIDSSLISMRLRKIDSSFAELWSTDVSDYAKNLCITNFQPSNQNFNCEILVNGSDESIWLINGLNRQNFDSDQTLLPQNLRTAMALTRFALSDGHKIVAIKHYGMYPKAAVSIGDRTIWAWVQTTDSDVRLAALGRNVVIDLTTGALKGFFDTRFGLAPSYGPNGMDIWHPDTAQWVVDQGFTDKNPKWFIDGNECPLFPFQTPGASWIGAENIDINWYSTCRSAGPWGTKITNDGRRLILVSDKQLAVFEITEDASGLPRIDVSSGLIRRQTFAANIKGFEADESGNVYVVGSTSVATLTTSSYLSRSPLNSYASVRAFINRNPGGRISLDVLPRTPLRIKVAGTNGVPATGVGAVSMNVTVTSPDGEGFITVYPCDSKPDASNLNYTLDQTVPNAVIAPVSSTGDVCFYTNAQTHLLADINGYFPAGQGFTAAGPARVFDTRSGSAQGLRTVNKVKIGGDQEVRVQMTGIAGITPSTGVGAVSLNITATGTTTDDFGGYVTVYPCGNRPNASSLNFVSGQTVPNAVIAPVSASGEVCFYARGTTDLIVDINGYFLSGAGFTSTTPTRIADTRSGSDQGIRTVTKAKVGGDTTLKVKFTDIAGLTPSSGVGAVSLNVTATGTIADIYGGYVTVYPCGSLPNASNLNFVSGQTVPNAVIAPVSATGEVCFYARGATDLIVDLNGYFPAGAGFTPMSPVRLFDTR
jgi:hypothetical protein